MSNKVSLLLACLLLPFPAMAQQLLDYTETDPTYEAGARLGLGVEKSFIPKTMTVFAEEQIRFNDNFSHFQRSYTTVGLDYRILPWLKAGVSGSYILNNSTDKGWTNRFRGAFWLTESVRLDRWKLSLREKLQATYYADSINLYQNPKTRWVLKTRVKAEYDIPRSKYTPYISAELRNTLNAVNPANFIYNEADARWTNTSPVYNDVYINRLRLVAGTEYKFPDKNTINLFIFSDLCWDLGIDFNSSGRQKKNSSGTGYKDYLFLEDSYLFGLGLTYTFKL